MNPLKPLTFSSLALAALITLLAVGNSLALTKSPTPVVIPNVTATTPKTTTTAVEGDIRDIRPPIHIPYGWLWAIWVAAGLGATGLAYATWRWMQQRAHARRKLLYELTLEQLESIRSLMQPEQAYQFSIAVSEIVRNYIEQRFAVRAAHRTTEEFLHDLLAESQETLTHYRPLLADFLEHCDLAKFARWQLSMPQMEAMLQSACTFVIETGKPAEPAGVASATAKPQPVLAEGSAS